MLSQQARNQSSSDMLMLDNYIRPNRNDFQSVNEMLNYPWPDTNRIYVPAPPQPETFPPGDPTAPPSEQPEIEVPTQRRPFNFDEYPQTLHDRVREFLRFIRSRYHRWQNDRWLDRYEAQRDKALRTLEPSTVEERLVVRGE
jgi:hypothetical protein